MAKCRWFLFTQSGLELACRIMDGPNGPVHAAIWSVMQRHDGKDGDGLSFGQMSAGDRESLGSMVLLWLGASFAVQSDIGEELGSFLADSLTQRRTLVRDETMAGWVNDILRSHGREEDCLLLPLSNIMEEGD